MSRNRDGQRNNDRTERTAEPGDGPATGGPSAPGQPEDGSSGKPSSASTPDADTAGQAPDESDTPADAGPLLQSVTPDDLPDPTESMHLDGSSRQDGGSGHDRVFIADAPRPDDIAAQRELERIVDESVGELPDDYREVIMLRTYCGGSWEYVCNELGHVSSEASRQLHRRARIRLGRIVRARIARGETEDEA